ncbi:sulfatase [Rubritalea tangerina]|uniref:Sulfatase n=1 Tax=Rubritalea tangerina TaxID=430798 RepID=A0ABW4Z856_9BACT
MRHIILTTLTLLGLIATLTSVNAQKPNFIVIFADDLGYGDLGCFGNQNIRTPRIDQLAQEGMKFDHFYAQNVCGPSRSALLTGCYPLRNAKKQNKVTTHPFLHSKELTIAEVLKPAGYLSACIGKWDQAGHSQTRFDPDLMPRKQGFDYFFGTPSSNDLTLHLMENETTVSKKADMATCTQLLTDKAIAFIERNQNSPFFLYLAHPMPHVKLDATPRFKGKSSAGLYGDVVEELDFHTGRLIDTLHKLKLSAHTYVIFTSDNGPWYMAKSKFHQKRGEVSHGGSAHPLRGYKVNTWEGGARVPCIVWNPQSVPPGHTNSEIARTLDFLPTFAALAGAPLPQDRIIDGKDITPLIHNTKDATSPSNSFFYYSLTQLMAVRKGDWKLHLPRTTNVAKKWNVYTKDEDILDHSAPLLFNIKTDPSEQSNLASHHPEIVADLTQLANQARADIGDYNRIGSGARFFDPQPKRPDISK